MKLYHGADASNPMTPMPDGTQILAGYIGGNTPHVWTPEQWNQYIRVSPDLRVLPVWVQNITSGDPAAVGTTIGLAARQLGWAANLPGAERRLIVVDAETTVNSAYYEAMDDAIWNAGYRMLLYGSADYVRQNYCAFGYWEADLTPQPPGTLISPVQGKQWQFGERWDLDVFTQAIYEGCGIGLRHG